MISFSASVAHPSEFLLALHSLPHSESKILLFPLRVHTARMLFSKSGMGTVSSCLLLSELDRITSYVYSYAKLSKKLTLASSNC